MIHNHIESFVVRLTSDLLAVALSQYGKGLVITKGSVALVLPFLESYFNDCIHLLSTREDAYLDAQFDTMLAADTTQTLRLHDLFNHVVILTLRIINDIDLTTLDLTLPTMELMDSIRKCCHDAAHAYYGLKIPITTDIVDFATKKYSFTFGRIDV